MSNCLSINHKFTNEITIVQNDSALFYLLDIEQGRKRGAARVDGDGQRRLDGESHQRARVLREQVGDLVPKGLSEKKKKSRINTPWLKAR